MDPQDTASDLVMLEAQLTVAHLAVPDIQVHDIPYMPRVTPAWLDCSSRLASQHQADFRCRAAPRHRRGQAYLSPIEETGSRVDTATAPDIPAAIPIADPTAGTITIGVTGTGVLTDMCRGICTHIPT